MARASRVGSGKLKHRRRLCIPLGLVLVFTAVAMLAYARRLQVKPSVGPTTQTPGCITTRHFADLRSSLREQNTWSFEYDTRSDVQQQPYNATDTDADVGPWQPSVVADSADAAQPQPAASEAAINVSAHVRTGHIACAAALHNSYL